MNLGGGEGPKVEVTKDGEQIIGMKFPERHWLVILAAIDRLIPSSARAIEDLREKGTKPQDIPRHMMTAIAGPIIIRGVIIKELVERGIMRPEANEQMGIDALMAGLKETGDWSPES
jgi:hypothetical protein